MQSEPCIRASRSGTAGLSKSVMRKSATSMTLSTSDLAIDARRTALMLMDSIQPAILAQHCCVIAADYN